MYKVSVTFHGVRGSFPVSGEHFQKYGGNTSCVEVRCGPHVLILDAGSGIRQCGQNLMRESIRECCILLSHLHWDHIQGFPFFAPAFHSSTRIRVFAGPFCQDNPSTGPGKLEQLHGVHHAMFRQMSAPFFPLPLSMLNANFEWNDFQSGETLSGIADDITIETAPLNHPNGATGYRISYGPCTLSYITDTEHEPGEDDQNVLRLMKDADLVIYDCAYREEQFASKRGWGHSTWNEGIRLCKLANAKQIAMFHHDPENNDTQLAAMEKEAKKVWTRCFASVESSTVVIKSES